MPISFDLIGTPTAAIKFASASVTAIIDGNVGSPVTIV